MDIQYTASYHRIKNANFQICNLSDNRVGGDAESVYCILNNILIRGCPAEPSADLCGSLGISVSDTDSMEESDVNRLEASIRLQLTLIRMLMSGMIVLDEKMDLAVRTEGADDYEKQAVDDLLDWIENLFTLADITFDRPEVSIQSVDSFEEVDYGIDKIRIDLEGSDADPESEFGVVHVRPMYDQEKDFSVLEISDPVRYSFSRNEDEKNAALRFVLKRLFGFEDFWPGQEKIVKNALQRKDTIGVLPTGSGKSLCYQICALLQPCLTICIAPIKSLMIDQCRNLNDTGITRVAYISSDLTMEERNAVTEDFKSHKYILTYMAPERFQSMQFRVSLTRMMNENNCRYGHVVIDEVHCMSEWGHSFRTSYLNLIKTCKKYCGDTVLFGLTATASENVLRNIKIEFGMQGDENVISIPSFTRKELDFKVISVKRGSNKFNELNKILEHYMYYHNDLLTPNGKESMCGIVFTPFASSKHKFGCAKLARDLKAKYGADIRCYAGIKPNGWDDEIDWDEYKKKAQNDYKDNDFTMIVATKAFGVGIDKKNVRYAIHYGLPSSLESLYQEAGRAGRDKNPAQCIVIYDPENPLDRNSFNKALLPSSTVEELNEVVEEVGFKGGDLSRQVFLFSNNSITYKDEISCASYILGQIRNGNCCIDEYHGPEGVYYSREMIEKVVYHLSVIGVIDDWTVDWGEKQITVIPVKDYTFEDLIKTVNEHIHNYNREDGIDPEDDFFKRNEEKFRDRKELLVLAEYYKWYHEKIIGYRKQSLINIVEACDEYEKNGPEKFKDTMESYFRISDITLMIGQIADDPEKYEDWFRVFELSKDMRTTDAELAVNLGRFLESFQNNLAIDFLSGMSNLLAGSFESLNGRRRLESAVRRINEMEQPERIDILNKSIALVAERNSEGMSEQFSRFMIENIDVDDVDEVLYRNLNDDYSLMTYMKKTMSKLAGYAGQRMN